MKHRYLKVFAVAISLMGGMGEVPILRAGYLDDLRAEIEQKTQHKQSCQAELGRVRQELESPQMEAARTLRDHTLWFRYVNQVNAHAAEDEESGSLGAGSQLEEGGEEGPSMAGLLATQADETTHSVGATADRITKIVTVKSGGVYPYIRMENGAVKFLVFETATAQSGYQWSFPGGSTGLADGPQTIRACLEKVCGIAVDDTAGICRVTPEQLTKLPHIWDPRGKRFLGFFVDLTEQYRGGEFAHVVREALARQGGVAPRVRGVGLVDATSLPQVIEQYREIQGDGKSDENYQKQGQVVECDLIQSFSAGSRELRLPRFVVGALAFSQQQYGAGPLFSTGGGQEVIEGLSHVSSDVDSAFRDLQTLELQMKEWDQRIETISRRLEENYQDLEEAERFGNSYPVSFQEETDVFVGDLIEMESEEEPRSIMGVRHVEGGKRYELELSGRPFQRGSGRRFLYRRMENTHCDSHAILFSDENWEYGVSKTLECFFVHNTVGNRAKFSQGKTLVFLDAEEGTASVVVSELAEAEAFLHVHVNGSLDFMRAHPGCAILASEVDDAAVGASRVEEEQQVPTHYEPATSLSGLTVERGEGCGVLRGPAVGQLKCGQAVLLPGEQEPLLIISVTSGVSTYALCEEPMLETPLGKIGTVRVFDLHPDYVSTKSANWTQGWVHGVSPSGNFFFTLWTVGNQRFFDDLPLLNFNMGNGQVQRAKVTSTSVEGPFMHVYFEPPFSSVRELVTQPLAFTVVQPPRLLTMSFTQEIRPVVENRFFTRNPRILMLPAGEYQRVCQPGAKVTFYRDQTQLVQYGIADVRHDELIDALFVTLDGNVAENVQQYTTQIDVTAPQTSDGASGSASAASGAPTASGASVAPAPVPALPIEVAVVHEKMREHEETVRLTVEPEYPTRDAESSGGPSASVVPDERQPESILSLTKVEIPGFRNGFPEDASNPMFYASIKARTKIKRFGTVTFRPKAGSSAEPFSAMVEDVSPVTKAGQDVVEVQLSARFPVPNPWEVYEATFTFTPDKSFV